MGDSHEVPFFSNLMTLLKFNHSEQASLSEEKDMLCVFWRKKIIMMMMYCYP